MKKSRNGFTLIEAAVSIAVLGVVSTTVVEVIQWSAAQHRQAERKRCALEAATTILDEFTLRDWSAMTQENAAKMRLARRNHSGFRGSADVPACERGKRGGRERKRWPKRLARQMRFRRDLVGEPCLSTK